MDAAVWISILVGLAVALFVVWVVLLETSFVVEPGTLALVLRYGKATGRAAEPGRHFIQPWRKATIQIYPSRELSLVAGGRPVADPRVELADDPVRVHLQDRALAEVSYTLRCRLDPARLREIHERFGPDGVWPALRDAARRGVIAELARGDVAVDDVYGDGYPALEARLSTALTASLADIGFTLTSFTLREIDLGETGDVVQSTVRADAELVRERSLAALRRARLENDAALVDELGVDPDVAFRYRQVEAWQDLVHRWDGDRPIPAVLSTPLAQQSLIDHHVAEAAEHATEPALDDGATAPDTAS
jgi:regulator of protease activity HflC (stomatin/prohibitin superfamily)